MGERTPEQDAHRLTLEASSQNRGVKGKHGKTAGQRVIAVLKYLAKRNDRIIQNGETPAQDWHKKMYGDD